MYEAVIPIKPAFGVRVWTTSNPSFFIILQILINDFKLVFDDVDVCNTLQKNIHSSYKVIEHNTPNCINKNKYIHIKINSDLKKDHKENKKFMMYVALSFLKEFPSRLYRFLVRKMKKN